MKMAPLTLVSHSYDLLKRSLLIKRGDLEATEPRGRAEAAEKGVSKHQAIINIDMNSWEDLIKTFDIQEPMIPHREEVIQTNVGARGWYS